MILFGQIYYLMPLKEALQILSKPISPPKSLNCPGFPKDSLFYRTMAGEFGDGFDKLLFITDSTDRIAAVELVERASTRFTWSILPCFPKVARL